MENKESTNLKVYKLDKNISPIFFVDKLVLPNQEEFSGINFALRGYYEGLIQEQEEGGANTFILLIRIKYKSSIEYSVYKFYCQFQFNTVKYSSNEFEMKCGISSDIRIKKEECEEYKLLPYFIPEKYTQPYEIIILNDI